MQPPRDTEGLLNMKTNLHDIVKEFMLLEAPSGYESKMAYAMKGKDAKVVVIPDGVAVLAVAAQ